MAKNLRIDNLQPGAIVTVEINRRDEENNVFLGIEGTGEKRRARFSSVVLNSNLKSADTYEFEVYRYNRRWAYGSSAEPFRLVGILAESPFAHLFGEEN